MSRRHASAPEKGVGAGAPGQPAAASLGEFELIARHFAPLSRGEPGALGLTDDAAWLEVPAGQVLVATKDAMVADRHFFADDPPEAIARKLLRVNLSDLAAMGARPRAYLLALALTEAHTGDWLTAFVRGLATDQKAFDVTLIGGDTVATPGPVTVSLTLLGEAARDRLLRRDGARPGDRIWVSGAVGDAALALERCFGRLEIDDAADVAFLEQRRTLPTPRVALGSRLAGLASAAVDISDGLVADLGHICETSGVAAVVEAADVPLSDAARRAVAGDEKRLIVALTGGDDYELLFTAPDGATAAIESLAGELGLALTAIGRIERGHGVRVVASDGRDLPCGHGGHVHF